MTARSLLLLLLPTAAAAAPTIVAPPLEPGAGVPAAIGAQFDISLRKALAGKGTLVGAADTSMAMNSVGATGACSTDDCGKKLAAKTNARFVVSATVTSADEIYQVSLSTYDAGRNERSVINGTCELCTAGEVNGTIATAVGKLDAAFAKPLAPAAPQPQSFEVKSTPPGAEILIDGAVVGQTPATIPVLPGQRVVELRKQGFVGTRTTVIISDKPVSFVTELKAVPPPVVAAVPVTAAPPVAPPVVAPVTAPVVAPVTAAAAPRPANPALQGATGKYNNIAWGMTIGGIALAGVGTWLIVLDGDVTCDDGRGRTTCPTVYNTKGVGIAGLGLGAALIGASIAIFAVGPANDEPADGAAFDVLPEGGGMVRFGGRF